MNPLTRGLPAVSSTAALANVPRRDGLQALTPLILDAGVPLASYYLLTSAGLSVTAALAWSSVAPAGRVLWQHSSLPEPARRSYDRPQWTKSRTVTAVTIGNDLAAVPVRTGMSDVNETIVTEFRTNGGEVGGQFAGAPMLLLHTTGARSGKEYVRPLMYLADEGRYLVFASKGGADTNPSWYHNLKVNPDTTIEVGTEKIRVHAVEVRGQERDRLYARQAELYPGFADYQKRTTRIIPVVALEPA